MKVRCRVVDEAEVRELEDKLCSVVNSSYRCLPGTGRSWTHEGHLICGDRINAQQLRAQLATGSRLIGAFLLNEKDEEQLVGSVVVSRVGEMTSLEMLNVDPEHQGLKVGSALIHKVEELVLAEFGAESVLQLCVLSKRVELIEYYKRRGFAMTDKREAFPTGRG
jgi:GNAT superfamily N-acetyltransferase